MIRRSLLALAPAWLVVFTALPGQVQEKPAADPLPSWNDVRRKRPSSTLWATTDKASPKFVPVAERIATFDNDGTLWVEQPLYPQVIFALDRVKALAPKHPEWKTTEPFKSILDGDRAALTNLTRQHWEQLFAASTGGGQAFVRAFSQRAYGVGPEQVIGSSMRLKYVKKRDGPPVMMRLPALLLIDDEEGKPEDIELADDVKQAKEAGFTGHLLKPVDLAQLQTILTRIRPL